MFKRICGSQGFRFRPRSFKVCRDVRVSKNVLFGRYSMLLRLNKEKSSKGFSRSLTTSPFTSVRSNFPERFDKLCRSKLSLGRGSRNVPFGTYSRPKFSPHDLPHRTRSIIIYRGHHAGYATKVTALIDGEEQKDGPVSGLTLSISLI